MNCFSSSQMTPSCNLLLWRFATAAGAVRSGCIRRQMIMLRPCPSGKCLARKHNQTSFGDQTHVDVVSVNRKYWHIIKLDLVITTITKRKKLLFY